MGNQSWNVNKCVEGEDFGVCVCGQVWLRLALVLVYPINAVAGVDILYILADGTSQCSATLDDSVSEEEEDGSFDELTDVTPYLQPGVELSVLNEVSVKTDTCHVVTPNRYLLQKYNFSHIFFVRAFLVVSHVKNVFGMCA